MRFGDKYEGWLEEIFRTFATRDLVFSDSEMAENGMVRIINCYAEMYKGYNLDKIVSDLVRYSGMRIVMSKIRHDRASELCNCAMVEMALRTKEDKDGKTNTYSIISVVIFKNEYFMHRYVLRDQVKGAERDMLQFSRLCN